MNDTTNVVEGIPEGPGKGITPPPTYSSRKPNFIPSQKEGRIKTLIQTLLYSLFPLSSDMKGIPLGLF